jgi:XTP/dITP diphosphohydrolase
MTAPGGAAVVLLHTVAALPGALTRRAWQLLADRSVFAGAADHPQLAALAAEGIGVTVVAGDAASRVAALVEAGPAVWLTAPDGGDDAALAAALAAAGVPCERVAGVPEVPGLALLDAVAVMDRLRSPGGCPWDADQTHASLARYLLEEAYEAHELLATGDVGDELAGELGDVLLQVLFHARLAAERPDGWDVDDVAAGLVAKMVRRHPHVFAGAEAGSPDDLLASWDALKQAEGRQSVTEGVAMGQPALALAAKLQSRAARALVPPEFLGPELLSDGVAQAAAGASVGELLWAVVRLAREAGADPEAELAGVARRFRDTLVAAEAAGAAAVGWRDAWPADGARPAVRRPW